MFVFLVSSKIPSLNVVHPFKSSQHIAIHGAILTGESFTSSSAV
jgi:hypothetical protein